MMNYVNNQAPLSSHSKEKLISKLYHCPRPENLDVDLKLKNVMRKSEVKLFNLTLDPRCKEPKNASFCFEAPGSISNITFMLLDLSTNKDQIATDIRTTLACLIHTCTDSIVILGHVNSTK